MPARLRLQNVAAPVGRGYRRSIAKERNLNTLLYALAMHARPQASCLVWIKVLFRSTRRHAGRWPDNTAGVQVRKSEPMAFTFVIVPALGYIFSIMLQSVQWVCGKGRFPPRTSRCCVAEEAA